MGRAESSMQTNEECQGNGVKVEAGVGEEPWSVPPPPPPPNPPKAMPRMPKGACQPAQRKRTAAILSQCISPSRSRTRSRSAARQGQGRQATKCDGDRNQLTPHPPKHPPPPKIDTDTLGSCLTLLPLGRARGSIGLENGRS